MKESSPEYWYVVYRETKASPLQVMKVRGLKLEVMKAVRNAGYKVPLAFNFDSLLFTQEMSHAQFSSRYTNYVIYYYYDFVQSMDVWGKYPIYPINNIPRNEGKKNGK